MRTNAELLRLRQGKSAPGGRPAASWGRSLCICVDGGDHRWTHVHDVIEFFEDLSGEGFFRGFFGFYLVVRGQWLACGRWIACCRARVRPGRRRHRPQFFIR